MTTVTKNGAPRKQLSEQIDRLDGVIDALDEGLKGAVADAVREAVGEAVNQAVQAVLMELMTNPQLQQATRQASAPAEEQPRSKEQDKPNKAPGSLLSRLWGRARSAVNTCIAGVGTALRIVGAAWCLAGSKTKTLVLAAVATAAGAAYAAREKIAGFVTANAGRLLGRLAPCAGR